MEPMESDELPLKAEEKTDTTGWAKRSALVKALSRTPREIQIIVEQTAIIVTFILADLLIVWMIRRAFSATINNIPFVGYAYDGIELASVIVITIRYFFNCISDMNRSRKHLLAELQENKKSEDK